MVSPDHRLALPKSPTLVSVACPRNFREIHPEGKNWGFSFQFEPAKCAAPSQDSAVVAELVDAQR